MVEKHPSLDILESLSSDLKGKKILWGVCGSVALLKSVELSRLLLRHGAQVIPVMSEAACQLINPQLIHWATGVDPIITLTGAVEHVHFAGNTSTKADLFLIAPATANTICKIACGIDDTPVTTCATTALGEGIPLLIVPSMHQPMYQHPAVKEKIQQLKDWGVRLLSPRIEEGKAKIPSEETILQEIKKILNPQSLFLKGEKILITAGRTVEYLDDVRTISNNSSGKMGVALAQEALNAGGEVTLIAGKLSVPPPQGVKLIQCEGADEMACLVEKEVRSTYYHRIIAAAAVGDWKNEKPFTGKISTHSHDKLTITLVPTKKILDQLRQWSPKSQIVAFRALPQSNEELLKADGLKRLQKASADFIAINDVSAPHCGFESDSNRLLILDSQGELTDTGLVSKKVAARFLLQRISNKGD